MFKTLRCVPSPHYLTIHLQRPQAHNALNGDMVRELIHVLQKEALEPVYRFIVLRGDGKSFCAGADLTWMSFMGNQSLEANQQDAYQLAILLEQLYKHPKPIMSLIHGNVYGGGVGLVAASDIAIATQDTVFCLSEIRLGLVPAVISPYVISALGERSFRHYALTGKPFKAEEAYQRGLIHAVSLHEEELEAYLHHYATYFIQAAPEALKTLKKLIPEISFSLINLKEETSSLIASLRASQEGKEGLSAFQEKRRPSWFFEDKEK